MPICAGWPLSVNLIQSCAVQQVYFGSEVCFNPNNANGFSCHSLKSDFYTHLYSICLMALIALDLDILQNQKESELDNWTTGHANRPGPPDGRFGAVALPHKKSREDFTFG